MTDLFGHEEAVAMFRAALDSGRLHHAWLITGPRGIGKATFARKAALRVLAQGAGLVPRPGLDVPDDHPSARYFASETHPDFRLLEREVWGGKPPNEYVVPKNERSTQDQPSRSIRVKQVRLLAPFLTVRPTLSDRRVIMIDAAEDMEPSTANALLKMLEEPPAGTTFLLVSHAPERLLPTIRSRCRTLRLGPLGARDMEAAVRTILPDATPRELANLAEAAGGAPGRALAFQGLDVDKLDSAMRAIAQSGDPTNEHRAALAQSLALKAAQPRYEAFLARAPSFIAAEARKRRGPALADALKLWEQASELSTIAVRQSLDAQATAFEMGGLIAGLSSLPRNGGEGDHSR